MVVSGADRISFLQALITNDMKALEHGVCLYACLLTAQGKFLHDFFLTQQDAEVHIDCEGGARAEDLVRRLTLYKLRAQVEIHHKDDRSIYTSWQSLPGGYRDPRHTEMGYRSVIRPEGTADDFAAWDTHRIKRAVPDGSRDMEIGSATLIECGLDKLNAVSFEKGCYIGQELTARMKHRGLAKKHLYSLRLEEPYPEPFSDLVVEGKRIGQYRSRCGSLGLALIKDEFLGLVRALLI